MEWLLPLFLGAVALAYITAPLWMGTSESAPKPTVESWHSVEQLEIDRELGKIDEAEYEELRPEMPVSTPKISIEALIFGARRQKRLNATLEAEVIIARARRGNKNT